MVSNRITDWLKIKSNSSMLDLLSQQGLIYSLILHALSPGPAMKIAQDSVGLSCLLTDFLKLTWKSL